MLIIIKDIFSGVSSTLPIASSFHNVYPNFSQLYVKII